MTTLEQQQKEARRRFNNKFTEVDYEWGSEGYKSRLTEHRPYNILNFLDTEIAKAFKAGQESQREDMEKELESRLADCTEYRSNSASFRACRSYNEQILSVIQSFKGGDKTLEVEDGIKLTKNQYDILVRMSDEWCYTYAHFDDTGLDRKTLRQEMAKLRKLGFARHVIGLMNDDGKVAGSGFCIPYGKYKEVRQLLDTYEKRYSRGQKTKSYL